MDDESAGKVGYEAYGEARDWKAFNDEPMPEWEDLPEGIKDAWDDAAEAILGMER